MLPRNDIKFLPKEAQLLCLLLSLCLVLPLAGCGVDNPQATTTTTPTTTESHKLNDLPLRVGLICTGKVTEENTGSYAIHNELLTVTNQLGLDETKSVIIQELVPELTTEVEKAVDQLVEAGATIIFGTALGYNEALAQAADKYPEVIFCQMGGTNGNDGNFVTYFAPLYYAYFMTGAAAAVKAIELESEDIGFISTSGKNHPEAAAIINAFTRGVQMYLPSATVHLKVLEPGATEAMEMEAVDDLYQLKDCQVFGAFTHTAGILKRAYALKLFASGPWFPATKLDPDPKDGHNALLVAPQVQWRSFFLAALRAVEQCHSADDFSMALETTNYYIDLGYHSFTEHRGDENVWLSGLGGGCAPETGTFLNALEPSRLFDIEVLPPTEQYTTGTVVASPDAFFFGPFSGFLYTVRLAEGGGAYVDKYEAVMVDTEGNIRIPAGNAPLDVDQIREMDYYVMGIELA